MKALPEDTEITYCWFCRGWHGLEKFCFGTLHRWLGFYWRRFKALAERWLEFAAYGVAVLALISFSIALLIALVGWLGDSILE